MIGTLVIVIASLLGIIIAGMFLVAWLDDRICALRGAADPDKETPPKGWCCCGQPLTPGVFHRVDGPCYHLDPRTAPTETIVADPDRRKTQRGSWGRA